MMNTDTVGPQRSARLRPSSSTVGDAGTMTRRSRPQQAQFRVDGVSCASEAAQLEHRLNRQVGVIGVSVNTITDFAYIAYDPALTSPTVLQRQIEVSGFGAQLR
jgi:copper chaperone CopZ